MHQRELTAQSSKGCWRSAVGPPHVTLCSPTPPTALLRAGEAHRAKAQFSRTSMVVSGMEASSIVVTMSTNGTPMSTALTRSGRIVTTAPIVRPPADRPSAHSLRTTAID